MFDADVSPTLISKSTDAVKEQMTEWQSRSLNALCLIVYPDCIVVKVRHGVSVVNKAVFLALSSNTEGQNELLGMWLAENEGAKFWLSVLTELKNRDLQDILIACVDGIQFSGCDKKRLSSDAHPVVHHPNGAQQPEIRIGGLKTVY